MDGSGGVLRNQCCQAAWAVALLLICCATSVASEPEFGTIVIPRVSRAPRLEDFLSMEPAPEWKGKLAQVSRFIQRIPYDGQPVSERTTAYLGYDNNDLYVVFVCFDSQPHRLRARLSRREDIIDDDSVEIMLDTFNDHRRAYSFLANPLGVQADALWTEGQGFDFSFDTVWDSRGAVTSRGYVVWMAIPFRSLRFASSDPQTWGILLNRGLPRKNEDTFWPHYSTRIEGRLNQEGQARGLEGISPGHNMQFIPYGIFQGFRELDLRDPSAPAYTQRTAAGRLGLDSKFVLKDKFVLDVTANPDFSQVESDEPQITISQRFEVFFPEKRPFFLENSNYFVTPIDMVFTRRIVDPNAGVRLTGKDGPWALGFLAVDDALPAPDVLGGTPAPTGQHAYFGIARVSRDFGSQSTVGLLYTDRELADTFNRAGGMDLRWKLNSHWVAAGQAVESSTRLLDGTYLAGPAFHAELTRQGRNLRYDFLYDGRSDGFRTLTGFDPQPDIHNEYQRVQYTFHPENSRLLSWGPQLDAYRIDDHEGNWLNYGFIPALQAEFPRQTFIMLAFAREAELLRPKDFSALTRNIDFIRSTQQLLFKTSYFRQLSLSVDYRWGKRINYAPPAGEAPFLARRTSTEATVTVRPTRSLRVDNTYLLFRLRDPVTGAAAFNNHIIRSKWNYQFTRAFSFRFIGQYNAVLANPRLTSLPTSKDFNADVLFTYLVHPSTAVYVGYNSNLENINPALGIDENGYLLRGRRFLNDGRHFFVKVSYLFRF